MVAAAALAGLALVSPAPAYDPEAAFAKGTTVVGLQFGGGAANNVALSTAARVDAANFLADPNSATPPPDLEAQ